MLEEDGYNFSYSIDITLETHETAFGMGFGVIVAAESEDLWTFGGYGMADPSFVTEQRVVGPQLKEQAEKEVKNVSQKTMRSLRRKLSHMSCIDDGMQAALLPYMALAQGKSKIFIGNPLPEFYYAQFAVEQTTGVQINVVPPRGNGNPSATLHMVTCEGIGFYENELYENHL
eukprot:TRINITY_DN8860_c0_g1_i2.p2 TRINITY_DN8860_c0_g1~~TRINITY_DN8860_c0_g1_i2.p2  ORF type:complete len:173 (-),score=31.30 TRINITY_DN8860_c0_g1_i2:118-636(-)